MSAARDELFELFGKAKERRAAEHEREAMVRSLVRGEAQIMGARVRLEWIDPKPDWVDEWAGLS